MNTIDRWLAVKAATSLSLTRVNAKLWIMLFHDAKVLSRIATIARASGLAFQQAFTATMLCLVLINELDKMCMILEERQVLRDQEGVFI